MFDPQSKPLILGFVSDLIFQMKISQAAETLNFDVTWIQANDIKTTIDQINQPRQYAEHLVGSGAVVIDQITTLHPALIIFDLGDRGIPWRDWLTLIKTAPATRRIPVICYGPHVDADALKSAKARGADGVFSRSQISSNLIELISKYAHILDIPSLMEACQDRLSDLALRGLELFNQGKYFEAHEYLEEAWKEEQTEGREVYRAILQVAVAYLQIERRNYNGAVKMFLRVRQWIDPLPDECRGVSIGKLRSDAIKAYQSLVELGRERIQEFDHLLMRPVVYRRQEEDT